MVNRLDQDEEGNGDIRPEGETEETLYSEKSLTRLASLANLLSWPVLVVYTIIFITRLVLEFQPGTEIGVNTAINLLGSLTSLGIGLAWFIVLQAISEGVYLLINIEENTR